MEAFLTKLSSYNFINYIFPGVVFKYFCTVILNIELLNQCTEIEKLFIYYFIGLCISRVGSLILEPFVKWIKFIKYAPYTDYLAAKEKDKDINILLEVVNTYRTLVALFLILMIICIYIKLKCVNLYNCSYICEGLFTSVLFSICFLVAYRKQVKYIKMRIENVLEK